MVMTSDGEDFIDPVTAFLDRRDATFDDHPPLMQYHDGTWAVIDERGRAWAPTDFERQLESPERPALGPSAIDVVPASVADAEHPDTPGHDDQPR